MILLQELTSDTFIMKSRYFKHLLKVKGAVATLKVAIMSAIR